MLSREARVVQSWAWAENTRNSLNSEQKAYIEFCRIHNIVSMPVSGQTHVQYVMYLVMCGRLRAIGSVRQYLSAESTLHRMFGLACDTPKTYGPLYFTVIGLNPSNTGLWRAKISRGAF